MVLAYKHTKLFPFGSLTNIKKKSQKQYSSPFGQNDDADAVEEMVVVEVVGRCLEWTMTMVVDG